MEHTSLLQRLVRRLSIRVEGSDYKERYMRLAEQFSLSDVIGRRGHFRIGGKKFECLVTGAVMRQFEGDYLIINYTATDGDHIEGAEIPRDSFIPSFEKDACGSN